MPIQHSITFDSGLNIPTAYIVVVGCDFNLISPQKCKVTVSIYKDQPAYTSGKPEIIQLQHLCEDSNFTAFFDTLILNSVNKNPVSQAEAWLLTLPNYVGATKL
jgi:hypothetical protein